MPPLLKDWVFEVELALEHLKTLLKVVHVLVGG